MRACDRVRAAAFALGVAGACSLASCGSDDGGARDARDAVATDAVATDAATTDAVATDAVATDAVATDVLATADGAGEVDDTRCDLVTSEGCPSDKKCTLGGGGRVCGPFGAGLDGASCQAGGDADCARGLACISVSGENGAQICRRFCAADGDCAAPSSLCLQLDPSVPPLFCTNVAHCDPFGDQCESGRACYPALYNDGSLVCLDNGNVADGEPCAHLSACKKGSVCVRPDAGAQGVCRELCGDAAPCADGACQMFPTSTVGYCP